jgi:hypothetical protein
MSVIPLFYPAVRRAFSVNDETSTLDLTDLTPVALGDGLRIRVVGSDVLLAIDCGQRLVRGSADTVALQHECLFMHVAADIEAELLAQKDTAPWSISPLDASRPRNRSAAPCPA